jgi:hypothetical protein
VRASGELTSIQPLEFIALRQDVLDSSGMERKQAAPSLRIPAPERRSVRSPAWTYPPPGSWKGSYPSRSPRFRFKINP